MPGGRDENSIEMLVALMQRQLELQQQHIELQKSQIAVLADHNFAMADSTLGNTQNSNPSCMTVPFTKGVECAGAPTNPQNLSSSLQLNSNQSCVPEAFVNGVALAKAQNLQGCLNLSPNQSCMPVTDPFANSVAVADAPEANPQNLPSALKLSETIYADTLPLSARPQLQVRAGTKLTVATASPRSSTTTIPIEGDLVHENSPRERDELDKNILGEDASREVGADDRVGSPFLAEPRPPTVASSEAWQEQLPSRVSEGRPTTVDVLASALTAEVCSASQANQARQIASALTPEVCSASQASQARQIASALTPEVCSASQASQARPKASALTPEVCSASQASQNSSLEFLMPAGEVLNQLSETSSLLLMLLGVLPARMVCKRRWLYHFHCICFPVAFTMMMIGQPGVLGRFDMLTWWAQVQYGVFFTLLFVVWLFARHQLQSPATSFGELLRQVNRGGSFSWYLIEWYGCFAMLCSIALAVLLYALCSWHIWMEIANQRLEISSADHLYLQVSLILVLHPSAVACCFPWLLFMITQFHCHDLRRFADCVAGMLKNEAASRLSMVQLDALELVVASQLRRSSESWGCMVALLAIASLGVGAVSLLNLTVSKPPASLMAHQLTMAALCLLIWPVQLLALLARVAHAFKWEVMLVINSPLALQAEAQFSQLGGALLAHFHALRMTWGLHIGGAIITTNIVLKFSAGLLLILLAAVHHIFSMEL